MLPGVRAFMAVQRLRELGEILACLPSADALQAATTPQTFSVRMRTSAGTAELERAVRSAGDVLSVRIEERRASAAEPGVSAPPAVLPSAASRRGRGTCASSWRASMRCSTSLANW